MDLLESLRKKYNNILIHEQQVHELNLFLLEADDTEIEDPIQEPNTVVEPSKEEPVQEPLTVDDKEPTQEPQKTLKKKKSGQKIRISDIPDPYQANLVKTLIDYRNRKDTYTVDVKNSDAISKIIYNPNSQIIDITFLKNGRTYRYRNVGILRASQLIVSNEKGELFNRDIKKNKPYKEII